MPEGDTLRRLAAKISGQFAGDVVERPISPKDILATTLHLLGIDPQQTMENRLGQPVHLVPGGAVIAEALA